MFDGEASIQTPLTPELLSEIPGRRGVLLLEGPDATPILLITAANIRARMRTRLTDPEGPSKRADLREVARIVRWKLSDSHFETDWRYLDLARRIYPDRYGQMLGFRPAWFIHVDPAGRAPIFRRSREPLAEAGRYYGPFLDGRSATRYIDALQDIFDLCRCDRILRQTPHGRPCVYAQMGRCRAPCDGSMPMDEYRELIARACRCVEGDRETATADLDRQMRAFAAERKYEQAAICKGRLERLKELAASAYWRVAPAEALQYVLIQRGAKLGEAKTFLVDRGDIRQSVTLKYPLQPRQLDGLLKRLRKMAAGTRTIGQVHREGIGLLSRYLYGSDAMRGLMVRCRDDLTAETLAEFIEREAEALRLRKPPKPPKAAAATSA